MLKAHPFMQEKKRSNTNKTKSTALAINNARQVFKQVVGLNIYQNDDAGLQLNIGEEV